MRAQRNALPSPEADALIARRACEIGLARVHRILTRGFRLPVKCGLMWRANRESRRKHGAVKLAIGCAIAFMALIARPTAGIAGTHIIDVCSYITTWEPARGNCYDTWMIFCPMIKSADGRTKCFAELRAAKAGHRGRETPLGKSEVAKPNGKGRTSPSRQASISSRDIKTGISTKSVSNADGTRTVTVRDAKGNILNSHVVPAKTETSMSSTDLKTGITIKSVLNKDGSRTVTRTDAKGNLLSSHVVPVKSPDEASMIDHAGMATRSVRNADGSRTVTKTDARGNVISKESHPPSKRWKSGKPKSPGKHLKRAPAGAPLLSDFCAMVPNPIAKKNCYNKTKLTKKMCELIRQGNPNPSGAKNEKFCKTLVARMPDFVGPFQ